MRWIFASLVIALACASAAAAGPPATSGCDANPEFHLLDFWIGDWDVFVGDVNVGEDRVEKILDGCAVVEDWTAARGGRGHSLFYYAPGAGTWKQVWVTQNALGPGGLKEKELVERLPDGGLRFQGEVPNDQGGGYLDRTTLTPVGPDEVHQLIETSINGGFAWKATFDARYVRRK